MRHTAITLSALLAASLPSQAKVGSAAPDLPFKATANFGKVKARSLADLKGSAVLVELWATW